MANLYKLLITIYPVIFISLSEKWVKIKPVK